MGIWKRKKKVDSLNNRMGNLSWRTCPDQFWSLPTLRQWGLRASPLVRAKACNWWLISIYNTIFKMQKRIVRIMMGYRNRVSCRSLFKRLEILPFTSQYILSLMLFVVKNKHFFILNSENHTKSTRQLNNLYHPITNLTVYQRGLQLHGHQDF